MQVTVTIEGVRGGSGGRRDVRVTTSAGATVAELAEALHAAGLGPAGPGLALAGAALHPQARLGDLPLHGQVLTTAPEAAAGGCPAIAELRVDGGPSCGEVHPLRSGAAVVGRGPGAAVRLDDDAQVSRHHLHVEVAPGAVRVADPGSTNGAELAGRPVGAAAEPWPLGERLLLGRTTLRLAPAGPTPAPHAAVDGVVLRPAPPRLRPPAPQEEVAFPAAPEPPRRSRLPLAAVVAPLLVGLGAAALLRSPTFLLFALLSPVVVVAGTVSERLTARRDHRVALARHATDTAKASRRLEALLLAEAARRHAADPSCADLLVAARGLAAPLWERRPGDDDALRVRLGTADLPAAVRVTGPGPGATCPRVPVAVGLRDVGALGIAGPRAGVLAVARGVVGSLAALHGPAALRLAVLAPGRDGDWGWAAPLPHLQAGGPARPEEDCTVRWGLDDAQVERRIAALEREVLRRRTARSPGGAVPAGTPAVVVVLDGAGLRALPRIPRLLTDGPAVGVHALCLADDAGGLPGACGAVLAREPDGAWTLRPDGAPPVADVTPDGATASWAEEVARRLAPVRDDAPDAGGSLPATVRWADLVARPAPTAAPAAPGPAAPAPPPDRDAVLAAWAAEAGPRAVLGVAATGPVELDLRRDGPHALVAGTTGSGKSELLQTLVAGLALAEPPEALQLVLVDYKGGAAFGACARLPHTAGLVTDLDPALTRRALASLGAELRRRERVLRAAGVADLDALDRLRATPGGTVPGLARLVIVVDEFATLAEELPEFVRGLVGVAQRGRSLGVHLVLATQRPEGAVSQDIRANTALRVCLAVAREAESRDVLGVPDAAALDRRLPGRGLLRVGADDLVAFQAARVAGCARPPEPRRTTVRAVTPRDLGDPPPAGSPAPAAAGPSDLDMLVAACREAAATRGVAPPPSPWLPPLPPRVLPEELAAAAGDGDPEEGAAVPLGLQDDPAQQRRRVLALDPAAHLAVVGGPGSGRTTALLAVAAGVARGAPPDRVQLVGLDCGGGPLGEVARLPHCGVVVGREDPERVARLVAALVAEVARRQAGAPAAAAPRLVLLLDQWDAFLAAYADADAGRLVEDLLRVLREGPAVGVTAAVTGDRSLLTGRVSALLPRRVLLRMPDPADYAAVGLSPREVPGPLGPGRGVGDDGLLVQLALPGEGDPAEVLAALAAAAPPPGSGAPEPLRVDVLPTRVTAAGAAALRRRPRPPGLSASPGVGGDRLAPLDVDLDETGPVLVVAGPPRSGRSTALLALLTSLRAGPARDGSPGTPAGGRALGGPGGPPVLVPAGPAPRPPRPVVVTLRPGPLRAAAADPAAVLLTGPADLDRLPALLVPAPTVLVVDDAEALLDSPVAAAVEAAVEQARDRGSLVLLGGATDALLGAYRGFPLAARRGRSGLLLRPESPADGELLGARLPRTTGGGPPLPGRGLLVVRGAAVPVQVALPQPPPGAREVVTGRSRWDPAA